MASGAIKSRVAGRFSEEERETYATLSANTAKFPEPGMRLCSLSGLSKRRDRLLHSIAAHGNNDNSTNTYTT